MASTEMLMKAADAKIRTLIKQVDPADLACHNTGYAQVGDLFENLVAPERARYVFALGMLEGQSPGRAVDLGCLFPYMPMLLTALGWQVTAVDRYSLYGPSMHGTLIEAAASEGFELLDLDMRTELGQVGEADLVLLMAVVEHLNGSPLELVRNIGNLLTPTGGRLLFEVPNIATLWHRLQLLRGVSPLPDYRTYLRSGYPFAGHNREMTVGEVRMLLAEAHMAIDDIRCFDYSPSAPGVPSAVLRLVQRVLPSCRESIMAVAHHEAP
ncbi:MAG TPA: methyltransferase domain-containing protein [Acidimicrobiales bacterium]|nr:methyltransferase domain-containing protein [Acidimicrobiales bacterium]